MSQALQRKEKFQDYTTCIFCRYTAFKNTTTDEYLRTIFQTNLTRFVEQNLLHLKRTNALAFSGLFRQPGSLL